MSLYRRAFLRTSITASLFQILGLKSTRAGQSSSTRRPVVIASANWTRAEDGSAYYNGTRATDKALELIKQGKDTLDAVVAGVNIVEDDPNEDSVGYGGLPNEEGNVELDAAVMHGPTNSAGAVAALQGIKNPSKVAKLVMERTSDVMLVGEGASRFAASYGFQRQDLLTERARRVWLRWRENRNDRDSYGPRKDQALPEEKSDPPVKSPGGTEPPEEDVASLFDNRIVSPFYRHRGTVCCIAVNEKGEISGAVSTSGLAFKIPGRVGDTPIIGAGLYVDNEVGAAGATGHGEEVIRVCGSFAIVENMRRGLSPEEACKEVLRRIVKRYGGRPVFNIVFYALNKQGEYGSVSLWTSRRTGRAGLGMEYAVSDHKGTRIELAPYLYEWKDEPKK